MTIALVTNKTCSQPWLYAVIETPWFPAVLVCQGDTVCYLHLGSEPQSFLKTLTAPQLRYKKALLAGLQGQLRRFFQGHPVAFEGRVDISYAGSFAQKVLKQCLKIPWGQVRSYGHLAALAGSPKAARAVGSIMAANRAAILIPCHRVVTAAGKLGGYSAGAGSQTKKALLEMEGAWKKEN